MYVFIIQHEYLLESYLVGPFAKKPSAKAVIDLFGDDHPEEADLLEQEGLHKGSVRAIGQLVWLDPENPSTTEIG